MKHQISFILVNKCTARVEVGYFCIILELCSIAYPYSSQPIDYSINHKASIVWGHINIESIPEQQRK